MFKPNMRVVLVASVVLFFLCSWFNSVDSASAGELIDKIQSHQRAKRQSEPPEEDECAGIQFCNGMSDDVCNVSPKCSCK